MQKTSRSNSSAATSPGRDVNKVRNRIRHDTQRISNEFRKPEFASPDELIYAIDEYIRTQPGFRSDDPTEYEHTFYDIQHQFEPYWQRLHEVFTGFVSDSFYNFILEDCADFFLLSKVTPIQKDQKSIEQREDVIEEEKEEIIVNVLNETTLLESTQYATKSWYQCCHCGHSFTTLLEGYLAEQHQPCPNCHHKRRIFPYKQSYKVSRDDPYENRSLHDTRRCIHCQAFNTLCLPSVYNALDS